MPIIQDKIYPYMPVFIQNLMISSFGYQWQKRRFGRLFKDSIIEARARELLSTQQWADYQTDRLRALLIHAYNHVPFYNEKFRNDGFRETDLKNISLSSLKFIPVLEKEDLRTFGMTSLLSDSLSQGITISSSGSSGTPTKIYIPRYFHQKWTALMEARVRNWAGVTKDTPRGMIGGRRIIPQANAQPPFYRYNHFERQTYFSAYHISPDTVENYLEGMNRNNVEYMTGYAMSNFLLAKYISEKGLKGPKLKAVITSSEKLTSEMRLTIEEVYQCRCYDSYSGCEACGLISETPENVMVVSPDAGIMEFINAHGNYASAGESGEIISTGLLNFDQPLIRYRIGDFARLSHDQSPVNGRYMVRIDEIEGRIEDLVVTSDGRSMVRFHGLYLDIPGLKAGQLIQTDCKNFRLNLIIDNNSYYRASSEAILKKRLESQVGEVRIEFNYPEKIEPNINGKFKAVISDVAQKTTY